MGCSIPDDLKEGLSLTILEIRPRLQESAQAKGTIPDGVYVFYAEL